MRWVRQAADFPYFDNGGNPIAFAHRGGAASGESLRLENSMHAFQQAVDLGYRYLETDANATRDGVLVAFHDATLVRTTGARGRISQLTYDEVRRVKIAGAEPIPLLHDVLTSWPEIRLNIDAKSVRAIRPLANLIDEHRAWDRVCVASFSAWRLHELRRAVGPRVASSYAAPGAAALRLLPTASLRKLLTGHGGGAVQVPVRKLGIEIVTAEFVARVHELGKQVHVWTIDVADEIERLLDLGVDAIMADRVDVLRDVFVARGLWRDEV